MNFTPKTIVIIKLFTMLYDEKGLSNGNDPCLYFPPAGETLTANYGEFNKISDQLLWNAFKRGDEPAFIRIYNDYSGLLYYYGCKYSPDKELVRDCLQDFFLYLRKNKSGFGDTNSIKLYLLKAFRRRIIEYLKKDKCQFNVKEPSEYIQFGVEASIEVVYINKQIKAEQMERLNKAINTLDPIEQEAIYYFYFKGLSYEQIARIFNFSHVSSARRVMYRSLRQLRHFFRVMDPHCEVPMCQLQ